MKWTKRDLDKLEYNTFSYEEDIDFSNETFPISLGLKSLKNIHVIGNAHYDSYNELLDIEMSINGIMVIPCARTNELIDYKFNDDENVTYSFKEIDEDVIIVDGNVIDTFKFVRDSIITSVPLAIYKEGSKPIENIDSTNNSIDPRLAKLKDLLK